MTRPMPRPDAEARDVVEDPEICGGDPTLEGTRIRVSDVVVAYDHHDLSPEDIVLEFPTLRVQDVHAALACYHARSEAIREEIREREAAFREAASGDQAAPGRDAGD